MEQGNKYTQAGLESLAAGGAIAAKIAERFLPNEDTKAFLKDQIARTIYRRVLIRR